MNDKAYIETEISSRTAIQIKTINLIEDLEKPVYAINWFNTRIKWLYTFYNMLAARSVFKIGGKIFFKAEVIKKLQGDNDDARELLLIVNYPSAIKFMELVKDRYFQFVSIFRMIAVKDFSFGFSQRLDSKEALQMKRGIFDESKTYAMHSYRTDKAMAHLMPLIQEVAESNNIRLYFAGQISSLLYTQNKKDAAVQIPCLMTGLLLFEANNNDQLEKLFTHPVYLAEINKLDASYIALLQRIM
jgi:uncharacterized protein (DUF1330 family)